MVKKILYNKNELLGDSVHHSSAMRDIEKKDEKNRVLNQSQEKKLLFHELKKYREGGVTEKEMKGVLADLKYGTDDHFTAQEVNVLAGELGVGKIEKKHLLSRSLSHTSRIDRAQHAANYVSKNNEQRGGYRRLPNDDTAHSDMVRFLKRNLRERKKDQIISGDLVFDRDEENVSFTDAQTGKRFFGKTSRLSRPHMQLRNQASLRGRGLIGGGKNM